MAPHRTRWRSSMRPHTGFLSWRVIPAGSSCSTRTPGRTLPVWPHRSASTRKSSTSRIGGCTRRAARDTSGSTRRSTPVTSPSSRRCRARWARRPRFWSPSCIACTSRCPPGRARPAGELSGSTSRRCRRRSERYNGGHRGGNRAMQQIKRIAVAVTAACSMDAMSGTSRAQAAGTESEAETEKAPLATITVTGSLLPTAPDAVAVPVIALDARQLELNGVTTNALEMLRKAIPSFAGRSNAGTSNANNDNQRTAGGSQLQLRNLPTLILVNGRRVANSGVGGINGKNFVDVNQIPAAAIDHIEVLTDGASSTYGSDAIGGVVNFILKSESQGVTLGGRNATAAGGYGERSAYLSGGATLGSVNITATGSFSRTDPPYQNSRSFTSPLYGKTSGIPGVVAGGNDLLAYALNSPAAKNPVGANATAGSIANLITNGTYLPTTPGAISAGFDVSPYQTLLLKQALIAPGVVGK